MLPRMSPACSVVVVVAAAAVAVAAYSGPAAIWGSTLATVSRVWMAPASLGLHRSARTRFPIDPWGVGCTTQDPLGREHQLWKATVESNSGKETAEFCPYVGRGIAFFRLAGLKFAQDFPGSKILEC